MLPYSATNRITVFKTARGQAALGGREEMDIGADESAPHILGG
jgi:hypothetical protein